LSKVLDHTLPPSLPPSLLTIADSPGGKAGASRESMRAKPWLMMEKELQGGREGGREGGRQRKMGK